jgi:hypothetical protein
LANHVERFGKTMEGYVAILDGGTDKKSKREAEIVESTLLYVAEDIDQSPAHNDAGGKRKGLLDMLDDGHFTVRIKVSGFHPLRWNSRMSGTHELKLRLAEGESKPVPEHPWKRIK